MDIKEKALKKHYEWQGKIEIVSKISDGAKAVGNAARKSGVARI